MPTETNVNQGALGRDEVFALIRERVAEILEIEEAEVQLDSSFTEDLAADSLALIELVEALEEDLAAHAAGFRIDDEDLGELRTVRDAVDYVVERLGGASGAAEEGQAG